jgi:hypothetical protein
MPRIHVQPDLLSAGGARQRAVADQLVQLGGQLQSATAGAAAAAGNGEAAEAISSFGDTWASVLEHLAGTIAARGANVTAAAGAYVTTDASAVRAP